MRDYKKLDRHNLKISYAKYHFDFFSFPFLSLSFFLQIYYYLHNYYIITIISIACMI